MFKRLLEKFRGPQPVQLPGYTAMGILREGSMAVIFKARCQDSGRIVAVKIHKPAARKAMQKLETQFRDFTEGEIAAAFDHANIVKCFGHGDLGGTPYLVMEYLEGMTLASLLSGDARKMDGRRLSFVRQTAAALAHIHSRRFIHHDFCPKNLFVTGDNVVKLIDFGLATPLLDMPTASTRMGTVEVLAPEVLRGQPSDYRVDVFAWGVVAYQILSGHWPFESADQHQALNKILNVRPTPIERRVPTLPAEVAALVMRSLEKEPAKRLSSMSTAIAVLDRTANVKF